MASPNYVASYEKAINNRKASFDKIKCLPSEVKSQIREKVIQCNKKIITLESWKHVIYSVLDRCGMALYLLLGYFVVPYIFDSLKGESSPFQFVFLGAVSVFISIILIYLAERTWTWYPTGLWPLVFLVFCILFYRSFNAPMFNKIPSFGQDVLRLSIGITSILLTVSFIVYGCKWFSHGLIERRIDRLAEEDIIDTLSWAVAEAEVSQDEWYSIDQKNSLMYAIESIAQSIEYGLPNRLRNNDAITDAWIRKSSQELATHIRHLKQYVLLPKEGDRERLVEELSKLMTNAIKGHWVPLENTPLTHSTSFISRFFYTLRIFFSVGFPLVIILVLHLKLIPIALSDTIISYINAIMLGWALLNVMSMIDPKFDTKLESLSKAVGVFKKDKD